MFFARKIDTVPAATADKPMPPPTADRVHCSLPAFHRLSEADVRRLIMSSAIKSSTLDPVPTFLLREFVDVLLPYVTCMVDSSLRQFRLPDSQKTCSRHPAPEAAGSWHRGHSNYRPVSNVTFMSKIVEHAVSQQLHQYLADNDLLPRYQVCIPPPPRDRNGHTACAFWCSHGCWCQQVMLLGLLDLSAAFDCVDHQLLL